MSLKIQKFLLVSLGMILTSIFMISTLVFSVQSMFSHSYFEVICSILVGLTNLYAFLECINVLKSNND